MRRFRPLSALLALALLTSCSHGNVARSEEPTTSKTPTEPQPLHLTRVAQRQTNSKTIYSNLPRESVLK